MCGLVLGPVMETPLSTWTGDQGTLRDGCQRWLLTVCPALAAQPSTRVVLSHSLRSFWTWQVEGLDALMQQTRVTNVLVATKDPWMCWNCAKESRSGVQECNHLISHSWSVPTAQSKRNGSLWHVGGTCTTSSITQTTTRPRGEPHSCLYWIQKSAGAPKISKNPSDVCAPGSTPAARLPLAGSL